MIETSEAIRTALELIGTPYSELDCINLIKKVIRTAPGGDKNYTTAGTNGLWNSDSKSAKYRDLTWKQEGISGAKAGMLAFMGVGTGDVNHVGLVTERGTVIHSSKSRGGVVETALTEKNGWNGLGVHRKIEVDYSEGGKTEVSEAEKIFGNATVNITSGYLNIREGASTRSKIIAKAENGTRVNVIREAGGTGWVFGVLESGEAGYMASEYLVEDAPERGDQGETSGEALATTTLRRSDGVYITLAGKWTIAED
nr:MAG TPA: SH3 domain protein [Caudoviricetes sp.]